MSFGFDLTKVDVEETQRGALPAGTYTAKIERVEKKTSKGNAANKYLNVMYKVCDMDKRNGAVFFDIVNIHNQNEDAQNIGRKRLKSMFLAAGASESEINNLDANWFIGKKVACVLGVESDGQYGDRNRVYQVVKPELKQENQIKEQGDQIPGWI